MAEDETSRHISSTLVSFHTLRGEDVIAGAGFVTWLGLCHDIWSVLSPPLPLLSHARTFIAKQ